MLVGILRVFCVVTDVACVIKTEMGHTASVRSGRSDWR